MRAKQLKQKKNKKKQQQNNQKKCIPNNYTWIGDDKQVKFRLLKL